MPLESAADRLGGWLCLHLHPGFRLMYDALEWDAVHFPGQYLKQINAAVNGYDRGFFDDPDVARLFLDATRECFRQGSGGLVEDATLLYRGWGIDLARVVVPVSFWQGSDDRLVPAAINEPVADAIPGAKWHGVAGAGHCLMLGEVEAILATCRTALADS